VVIEEELKTIRNFTKKEIEATGASLSSVKYQLMSGLDQVRIKIRRRIILLKNGLTTGIHSSIFHPNGLAVDFVLDERDGKVTNHEIYLLVRSAIDAGFKGIGIYKNTKGYISFHLDMRDYLTIWKGVPDESGKRVMLPIEWL
jgi:hypothetical protein